MFMKIFFIFLLINSSLGMYALFFNDVRSNDPNCGLPVEDRPLGTDCRVTITWIFGDNFVGDPNIYNFTNQNDNSTLVGNLRNPQNQSGSSADVFNEQTDIEAFNVWSFIGFFDGGFFFDTMEAFFNTIGVAFPDGFITMLNLVFGMLFGLFILQATTGRSFSSFT